MTLFSKTHAAWLLYITLTGTALASDLDQVINDGATRLEQNRQAQQQVNAIVEETDQLLQRYQEHLKIIDGLEVYNKLLQRQIDGQLAEKTRLQDSIANATVIERQIVPLLLRMVDGMEQFIALDVPFLLEERNKRVGNLRHILQSPDYSIAEKSRRVFEAYQIENDYGYTLEAYKGKLQLADKSYDVDFLRIGRISLLYRSVGNDQFGYWNNNSKSWVPVTANHYKRNISKGLKIARQEMAPDLLSVPIMPAQEP